VVDLLLKVNPDLAYVTDKEGSTALHFASYSFFYGREKTVEILLKTNTELVNTVDKERISFILGSLQW